MMEAKDTVMSESKMRDNLPLWINEEDIDNGMQIAQAQAEISFKAGYSEGKASSAEDVAKSLIIGLQQGRKEVVDWIMGQKHIKRGFPIITEVDWQAQLKEWEL